jgi:hypothetical protein
MMTILNAAHQPPAPGMTQQQIVFNINVTNPPPPAQWPKPYLVASNADDLFLMHTRPMDCPTRRVSARGHRHASRDNAVFNDTKT